MTTIPWTSTANPIVVPLTTGQRSALHAAAARRASTVRRTARKAAASQVPDNEQSALVSEAIAAQIVSALTNNAEAIVIRRTSGDMPRPRSLADVIVGEGLALTDAINAGDTADVAYTLATLAALVRDAQRELLDENDVEMTAAGVWTTNGRLTWPRHYRACTEGEVT